MIALKIKRNAVIDGVSRFMRRLYATMQEVTATTVEFSSTEAKDVLTEILRDGAQSLLVQAVETEDSDGSIVMLI
jgi:hypothetical protein